ncbi:hydrogenase maturation nickel metallochaperone HypA [Candidatus Desantisbacteria bacterium]|nr:hydrogenase maturation nickel metallochaperone HypA [Candidatus Desantisbacteria bacterium]
MHEAAIAQSILDMAIDTAMQNNAAKITRIRLKLGEYACINHDSLRFVFSCMAQESMAEGAGLSITQTDKDPFGIEIESIEVDD